MNMYDEPTEPRQPIKPQPTEPLMVMEETQEFLPAQGAPPTIPLAQGIPGAPSQATAAPAPPIAARPATDTPINLRRETVAGDENGVAVDCRGTVGTP